MNTFDADRTSSSYPQQLRDIRARLGLSQNDFAEAAGYSGVMQGRYETDRSKNNSAIPSERTAKAIRKMVEAALLAAHGQTAAPQGGPAPARRALKSLSPYDIERAIEGALGALLGERCTVSVHDIVWGPNEASSAKLSLSVVMPVEGAQ